MTSEQTTAVAGRDRDTHDIAVIGMAVRMPEADDVQQFLANLREGRDSVRGLSVERRARTSLSLDAEYQLNGYIEDIDSFDHTFFGISRGEAQNMAPEHRLLLQLAHQAVENAGYNPAALQGRRASVYIGDTRLMYQQLARTVEPTMIMGTHVSATAGRIARFFGLRGPAAMVDSSCSSALLAVHHAVNDLVLGDTELALVGGVNLNLFGEPKHEEDELDLGIRSADGKTRTFSADADGTGAGEAAATVLLKPLDKALRDGDPVHAVIKGIAANNVAGRSSTLTAPDSAAQAEVIERAWEKAGIDPATVSYIEAHGTATRLGDPIEIEALDLAFSRFTDRKQFCALSSVKSNIGHTWSASGLVGLVKAVLALRHRQLFASLHSHTLSPLIDFANSAVSVTQELTDWEAEAGVRRAGVSSFGVMGTNVHAVLEEAPARTETAPVPTSGDHWIPVSAKTATALEANLAALRKWIAEHPGLRIEDVQATLVGGRGHHPHRACVTAGDLTELSQALAAPAVAGPENTGPVTVLLVSGRCTADTALTAAFCRAHPHFELLHTQAKQAAGDAAGDPRAAQFAFQYALYGLLRHLGLEFGHVVGEGAGKHVIDAGAGRVGLDEALRRALAEDRGEATDLNARVDRLLAKLAGDGRALFVEAGPLSTVSGALAARGGAGYGVVAVPEGLDAFAVFLRDLYLGGAHWAWELTAGEGRRIELPSYQFDRVRCWLDESNVVTAQDPAPAAAPSAQDAAPIDVLASVTEVWRDVLGLDSLDLNSSFFELGGDSISGTQVLNRLQTRHGVELDSFAIFDYETPRTLAAYVEKTVRVERPDEAAPGADTQAAEPLFTPEPVAETLVAADPAAETHVVPAPAEKAPDTAVVPAPTQPFPASPAQLHIWLASQFEGGSVAFNLTRTFELTGKVNTDALRRALDALAARHDGLRTTFVLAGERLTQRIAPRDGFTTPLELRSAAGKLPADAGSAEEVAEFAVRPFDLEAGPLLRAQLVSYDGDRHLLTLSTHHIVADGWSLQLLVRDLGALYASHVRGTALGLPEVGADYREHHIIQEERAAARREQAAAYWLDTFDQAVPALDLPVRAGVGGPAFSGAYRNYALPEALWRRLKEYSKAEGGTVFTSVLSAFAAVLARYSENGDLVLGTSVAGRDRQSLEQLVGMLVRTLPLRLKVDSTRGFTELYEQVRGAFGNAVRHLDHPYEELVQELQRRGSAHTPDLFDVLIEFEQFGGTGEEQPNALAGPELQVTPVEMTLKTSVFPLNIMLAEQTATLEAAIRFDTRLFDGRTIDQLWEAFTTLLEAALDNPSAALEELPLLGADEQLRVRTHGHRDLKFDRSLQIHRAIERFAASAPDRECLSCGSERRTYAQLNARANQLARYFSDRLGVRPGEVVALVMDRSILMVESILALWKCGAAYLPVDPGYPPAFVRMMLESSRVRVVAFDPTRATPKLRAQAPAGCRSVDVTAATGADEDTADLALPVEESGLSYVIYTSGSTGVPKGVMVEHLGMLNHLHAKIDDLGLTEDSVVVQNASNSFDISLWQMFAAPFVGGRTIIVEEALQLDPVRFGRRVEDERVTVLEVVPSYLEAMLDSWQNSDRPVTLERLEYLMVTGEAVLPRQVNRWLAAYPRIPVVNAYGPTEASDDVTHHIMDKPVTTDTVPLGRPVPNTYLYVLDEHLRICPQGARGEIYVSGICVSRGYLNAPEQTARAFLTDPFEPCRRMYKTGDNGRWTAEGTLEYLGRTDSQVKVRGFRVDLGEIERRVDECPGVKSAAVITRDKELYAYVVLEPGASAARCRNHLHQELPQHMMPTDFIEVDRLPLTSNGKVDRKALATRDIPRSGTTAAVEPRTDDERMLAEIWAEVLGVEGIGVTDRFFDMGGNSLRATQVLARIRGRMGVEVSLETLFAQPTIADLAGAVASAQAPALDPITSLGGPGSYAAAPSQQLLLNIERTSPQPGAFHRNDLHELHGPLNATLLERAFALLMERHESLRTTYATLAGRVVQTVHAPGELPLPLRVHDLSAWPEEEVDAFIAARIRKPFEVGREPLVRADLIRTGEDSHVLLTSMHQLVSDGSSALVLKEDWQELYEALAAGRAPALADLIVQYKDVAAWRDARLTPELRAQHREFWLTELAGASSFVPLPTDLPRPTITALAGSRLRLPLSGELTERFADLAQRHGVTEFVVARCAVGLLLLAETGLTDVTMGTYSRGRNRLDLEGQIGFHINTVPLRFRLCPDDDVSSLLTRAQGDILRAFQHEEYPYGQTMRDLGWERGADRSPLFDVMVALDQLDAVPHERTDGSVRFTAKELPRRSKEADLQFVFLRSTDSLELAVTYNSEIFSPERARAFLARLRTVVESMTDGAPIIEILKQEEWAN